ncbi:CASP-like protein 4D1 [Quercus lobata]|nr:CASP-like protein 4D1 [Quercus lobata]
MELSKSHIIAVLLLRGISLLFLLLSFVILLNNGNTHKENGRDYFFLKIKSYSYMFAASIIGIGCTILQTIAFVIFQIVMESHKFIIFEFYGDKVISYLLLSAAAAGLGASIDVESHLIDKSNDHFNNYLSKGFAAANLLLPAFVCTSTLSILSSYALAKKV